MMIEVWLIDPGWSTEVWSIEVWSMTIEVRVCDAGQLRFGQ
jgi:hypothetical protein